MHIQAAQSYQTIKKAMWSDEKTNLNTYKLRDNKYTSKNVHNILECSVDPLDCVSGRAVTSREHPEDHAGSGLIFTRVDSLLSPLHDLLQLRFAAALLWKQTAHLYLLRPLIAKYGSLKRLLVMEVQDKMVKSVATGWFKGDASVQHI